MNAVSIQSVIETAMFDGTIDGKCPTARPPTSNVMIDDNSIAINDLAQTF